MSKLDNLIFKHFLQFELWIEGKRLLDFQIDQRKKNKFLNSLNFFYFEKIRKKTQRLNSKKYYNDKVANNMVYVLANEMFFYRYTVPKSGIGLRNYFFFGYPMAVLQYAIGLYFLRLTNQFISDHKRSNIKAYYGGNLQFDSANSNKLLLQKKFVFYYDYYRLFKSSLMHETRNPEDKIIIKLDIQNYFDSISISTLLKLIEDNIKPSILRVNNFDESTKDLIEFYYRFLNSGKDSLPQGDNNIISDFISYLYLVFGDLIIEDVIVALNKVNKNIVEEFKIIRYVDDTYISLKFASITNEFIPHTQHDRRRLVYNLLNKIADEFYRKLHLRFNDKANLFWIERQEEKNEFLTTIKKVSTDYPEAENEEATPAQKFISILDVLEEIKHGDIAQLYKEPPKHIPDTLKDIYDYRVSKIIKRNRGNISLLENKFRRFDFDLFRVYPQPLILLVNMTTIAKERFQKFLLMKRSLTTFDRGLIIHHLCQNNFMNGKLVMKLKEDKQIEPIIEKFNRGSVVELRNSGYYNLGFSTCKKILKQISLIEQIRMRNYAERTCQFSVGLNHLLNEFQLLCCSIEGKDIKKYDANKVEVFLRTRGVPNNIRTKINNLFDRRNNNPISHPGSDVRVAWSVSEEEYCKYKTTVNQAISLIVP